MVRGRTALVGLATVFTTGCLASTTERPPSPEPERTYVGQHDQRPMPTVAPVKVAPPTSCALKSATATGDELAQLSLFSRALFQLRDQYPRDITPRSRELLLAALWAIEVTDRDVLMERDLDAPPGWVSLTVKGERCMLNIERVDSPATVLSALQQAMRFIGSRLVLPASETGPRFSKIEVAATNGMLALLDRQSRLVDADASRDIRAQSPSATATTSVTAATPTSVAAGLRLAALSTGDEVAYVRPDGFPRGSAAQAEQEAMGSGGKTPKGVILDLRDNPGGLLEEAAGVADVFVERGVLGWIVGRAQRKALEAHDGGHDFAGAVVVLVNRRTSAGAELVASAIKSLGRGIVLGEQTAGAGSVREFFDLPVAGQPTGVASAEGGATAPTATDLPGVLLRTGYLWTANDVPLESEGVRPDLPLTWPPPPASPANDDCLLKVAQAAITKAPDARRSMLLATAKALASEQICAVAP